VHWISQKQESMGMLGTPRFESKERMMSHILLDWLVGYRRCSTLEIIDIEINIQWNIPRLNQSMEHHFF